MSLVAQSGPNNWVRISQAIATRSPKQCRERYHQNLKPSLNHSPITPEEGEQIEKMVNEMGKRWAEIARRLCGRSDNAVKNWWNGGVNRRRRLNSRRSVEKHSEQQAYSPLPPTPQHYYPPAPAHEPHGFPRPMENRPMPYHQEQGVGSHPPAQPYRPQPRGLDLTNAGYAPRSRGPYDTPLPSPSGMSVMSTSESAPSLMSDTSESRSPYAANSPIELPPLIGTRGERRRSSVAYLQPGTAGFAKEDDVAIAGPGPQLPSLNGLKAKSDRSPPSRLLELPRPGSGPSFTTPSYGTQTSTAPSSYAQSPSTTLPPGQQYPLPSLHTLASRPASDVAQGLSPTTPRTIEPPSRAPFTSSPMAQRPSSQPTSPRSSDEKDSRMKLSSITG
jgi:Myb-like DNA-binding protein FlbD